MKKLQLYAGLALVGVGFISEILILLWSLGVQYRSSGIAELWWLLVICMTPGVVLVGMGRATLARANVRRLLGGSQIGIAVIVALSRLFHATGVVSFDVSRSTTGWLLLFAGVLYGLLLFVIAYYSTRSRPAKGVRYHSK